VTLRGVLVSGGVVLLIAALVISTSCDAFTIPTKDCHGTDVNRFDRPEAGPNVEQHPCSACLSAKCCDDVGRCEELEGCPSKVIAAHKCVSANRPEEARCIESLDDRGRNLYGCMRRSCGGECDVPSCEIERSAALFATADCDRCMTASCCPEINECYKNRRCKLILECVSSRCGDDLGRLMIEFGRGGDEAIDAGSKEACTPFTPDSGPPDGGGQPAGGSSCVANCLDAFATDDGGPYDDADARCKAFLVFACASRPANNCGPRCLPPNASVDAAPDAPADAPVDGSSDQ
jgi:hypothetical protein